MDTSDVVNDRRSGAREWGKRLDAQNQGSAREKIDIGVRGSAGCPGLQKNSSN